MRAQAAAEFVLISSIMFGAMILLFMLIQSMVAKSALAQEENTIEIIFDIVENEIAIAYLMEHGYDREFSIPDDINLNEYSLDVLHGKTDELYLKISDKEYLRLLLFNISDKDGDDRLISLKNDSTDNTIRIWKVLNATRIE